MTLSGGTAQRLMVARAILHRPARSVPGTSRRGPGSPTKRIALWDNPRRVAPCRADDPSHDALHGGGGSVVRPRRDHGSRPVACAGFTRRAEAIRRGRHGSACDRRGGPGGAGSPLGEVRGRHEGAAPRRVGQRHGQRFEGDTPAHNGLCRGARIHDHRPLRERAHRRRSYRATGKNLGVRVRFTRASSVSPRGIDHGLQRDGPAGHHRASQGLPPVLATDDHAATVVRLRLHLRLPEDRAGDRGPGRRRGVLEPPGPGRRCDRVHIPGSRRWLSSRERVQLHREIEDRVMAPLPAGRCVEDPRGAIHERSRPSSFSRSPRSSPARTST